MLIAIKLMNDNEQPLYTEHTFYNIDSKIYFSYFQAHESVAEADVHNKRSIFPID